MISALRRIRSDAGAMPIFSGGVHSRPLTVHRMARARRMRLSVDPRDGTVRLTLPMRAALKPALAWAEEQRPWIERALTALPVAHVIAAGGTIPYQGDTLAILWREDAGRQVRREGDALVVGGPQDMLASRVLRWLRRDAAIVLDADTRVMAGRAGVSVTSVTVADPKARWGSCSVSGAIRYSWRLILAPPAVREATVAHEVAHRLHMHHGPEFHAAVERLLGRAPRAERAWLREHGAALYWLGRAF